MSPRDHCLRWEGKIFPIRRRLPPLRPSAYINRDGVRIPHELLHSLPLKAALLMAALLHLDATARTEPEAAYTGWFAAPGPWLMDLTGLTGKQLGAARRCLVEVGWIRTRRKGLPATLNYYVEVDRVAAATGGRYGELALGAS
jgi:hypothetical protein